MAWSQSPTGDRCAIGAVALLLSTLICVASGCGADLEQKIEAAEQAQLDRDFRSSIPILEGVIAEEPHHPRANYLLGMALVATQQSSRAIWPLREAATSDSEVAVQAGLTLAGALATMESYEEAVKAADGVLAIDPDSTRARAVKANALLRAKQHEEALALAVEVIAAEGEGAEALRFPALQIQAEALAELSRYEEAEQKLRELYELSKEKNPQQSSLACMAITTFRQERLEDPEAAEAQLEECLAAFPEDSGVIDYALWFYDRAERGAEGTQLLRDAIERAPDDFTLLGKLADRLRRDGKADEGEALLRDAAEVSETPRGWLALSHYLQEEDRRESALQAVERAIALQPGEAVSEPLLFNHADLLIDAGRLDEALEIAESFQQAAYRELIRGRVYQERGDPARALEAYERGVLRWPNNAHARFLAGVAAEDLGERARAKAHYREATRADAAATDAALLLARMLLAEGDYRSAYELVARHGHNRPHSASLFYVGAMAAFELERLVEADAAFRMLSNWEGQKTNGLLGRAAVARRASGPEKAAGVLRGADLDLALLENARILRALLGDLAALEAWDEAFSHLDHALAARPDDPALHDLRGRMLTSAGRAEEASLAFDRALEIDPGFGPALAGRAALATRAGALAEAIQLYDRAASAPTPDPEAAYSAAQLAYAGGDRADAERRLRAILEEEPFHASASNDLAWLLADAGRDLDQALELAERAVRLDPKHEAFDTLGTVHMRRQEPRQAASAFESAIALDPDSPVYRYQYGVALAASFRNDEALGAFREALARAPFAEEELARAELARLEATETAVP